MNTTSDVNESVIFSKSEKLANDHFTGAAWLDMLVPKDSTFNCPIGNVTFEPGARTHWHKHPGGQLLLVTGGKGYSQEEGMPARMIQEGDVEKVSPNTRHWHGVVPDSWLVHISITPNARKGDAEWLEPVTDEEYKSVKD